MVRIWEYMAPMTMSISAVSKMAHWRVSSREIWLRFVRQEFLPTRLILRVLIVNGICSLPQASASNAH